MNENNEIELKSKISEILDECVNLHLSNIKQINKLDVYEYVENIIKEFFVNKQYIIVNSLYNMYLKNKDDFNLKANQEIMMSFIYIKIAYVDFEFNKYSDLKDFIKQKMIEKGI